MFMIIFIIYIGFFTSEQEDYQLEYTDDPKRFRIQATFKVDSVIKDYGDTRRSIQTENIMSPTGLMDRALSSLSSNGSYNINEAYGGSRGSGVYDFNYAEYNQYK